MGEADTPDGGESIKRALALVVTRAVMLREAYREDWGGRDAEVRRLVWGKLMEALDDLELSEPGIHAELQRSVERIFTRLRKDLGIDPDRG